VFSSTNEYQQAKKFLRILSAKREKHYEVNNWKALYGIRLARLLFPRGKYAAVAHIDR